MDPISSPVSQPTFTPRPEATPAPAPGPAAAPAPGGDLTTISPEAGQPGAEESGAPQMLAGLAANFAEVPPPQEARQPQEGRVGQALDAVQSVVGDRPYLREAQQIRQAYNDPQLSSSERSQAIGGAVGTAGGRAAGHAAGARAGMALGARGGLWAGALAGGTLAGPPGAFFGALGGAGLGAIGGWWAGGHVGGEIGAAAGRPVGRALATPPSETLPYLGSPM